MWKLNDLHYLIARPFCWFALHFHFLYGKPPKFHHSCILSSSDGSKNKIVYNKTRIFQITFVLIVTSVAQIIRVKRKQRKIEFWY